MPSSVDSKPPPEIKNRILRGVQTGNLEIVKHFKTQYPNTHWSELRYKAGDTILHVTSRLGLLQIIDYLLSEYHPKSVDCKNSDDKTSLHEAAQFAQYEVIQLLLSHGANVNALKRSDWTALMLACTKVQTNLEHRNYKAVQLLLQNGALVNYENKDGWTTLHLICREGCVEIFELLLKYGLDVSRKTKNGRTALHVACLHGHLELVRLLLSLCLDATVTDNCGNNSLHEAVLGGSIDICNLLLKHGCSDLSATNKSQYGLLHLAASVGHLHVIKYLVKELQIHVNTLNSYNRTPLHCAGRKNQTAAVQCLIELGADVSVKDNYGRTVEDYLNI